MAVEDKIEEKFVLGTASLVGRAGGYGLSTTTKEQGLRILSEAISRGVRWFDTAPVYGFGEAENLLSEFSQDARIRIVSKCGIHWSSEKRIFHDNTPGLLWKNIEASLLRLKRTFVDLYMIHWPDPKIDSASCLSELVKMQEQGLVEAIGLSNFSPAQALQLSRDFPVSTVQNNFIDSLDSTFNRGIADLKKAGVKSQCYGVFGKGAFLSPLDKNRFSVNDFRRSKHCRAGDLEEQSRSLRQSIEPTAKNLSANTVLSYALARSNFDQFIIGQSSGDQLNQNLSFF